MPFPRDCSECGAPVVPRCTDCGANFSADSTSREARLERNKKIKAAADRGKRPAQIARDWCLSLATVYQVLGDRDTTKRADIYRLIALAQEGAGDTEVGRKVGLSRERVRQIKKTAGKAGIQFPRRNQE